MHGVSSTKVERSPTTLKPTATTRSAQKVKRSPTTMKPTATTNSAQLKTLANATSAPELTTRRAVLSYLASLNKWLKLVLRPLATNPPRQRFLCHSSSSHTHVIHTSACMQKPAPPCTSTPPHHSGERSLLLTRMCPRAAALRTSTSKSLDENALSQDHRLLTAPPAAHRFARTSSTLSTRLYLQN